MSACFGYVVTWRHRLEEVALIETSLLSCLGLDAVCGRKSADWNESARKTHCELTVTDRFNLMVTVTLLAFGEFTLYITAPLKYVFPWDCV